MNTKFYNRSLVILLIFTATTSIVIAQSSQLRFAGEAVSAADGCLGCPGTAWNDANAARLPDGVVASTGLSENGFCFQSTCYYSRYILATDFGFTIPENATILGIVTMIMKSADKLQSVKDMSVYLLLDGFTPEGNNHAASKYWKDVIKNRMYGSNTDLWGLSLSPSKINDSGFGMGLQAKNNTNSGRTASIDAVKIRIYYSVDGKFESQSAFAEKLDLVTIYPNPVADVLNLSSLNFNSITRADIVDLNGRLVISDVSENMLVDVSSLIPGVYILKAVTQNGIRTIRFIKQ